MWRRRMGSSSKSTDAVGKTLRDAFAPFKAELDLCMCRVCQAVACAAREREMFVPGADCGFYRAVSEQLRVAAAGTHARVEWDEWVASHGGYATPGTGPRVERHGIAGSVGCGLGIGGRL